MYLSKGDEIMKQQHQCLSQIAGANLKRLINEANLTQDEAAEKLLLSEGSCIRRLVRNGITKIDEIERIASLFGVPIYEMLRPVG